MYYLSTWREWLLFHATVCLSSKNDVWWYFISLYMIKWFNLFYRYVTLSKTKWWPLKWDECWFRWHQNIAVPLNKLTVSNNSPHLICMENWTSCVALHGSGSLLWVVLSCSLRCNIINFAANECEVHAVQQNSF